MKSLTARIAVAIAMLLLSTGNLLAGHWNWSPKAEHHYGVVKVSVKDGHINPRTGRTGGARGSGALIHIDEQGTGYILTAAHVVGDAEKAIAEWTDGYRSMGRVTHVTRKGTTDIAIFIVKPPEKAVILPVADKVPAPGAKLEVCGFGGPDLGIRHFFVKNRQQSNQEWSICEGTVLPGDSGGPILTVGESVSVVGLACNGFHQGQEVLDNEVTDIVAPIRGPGVEWINDFLAVACPNGRCGTGPFGGILGGNGNRMGGGSSSRPPADSGPQEEEYVPPKKGSTGSTGPIADAEKESLKKKLAELEAILAEKNKTPANPGLDEKVLDEKLSSLQSKNQKAIDAILADNGDVKNRIAKVEAAIVKIDAKVSTGNQGLSADDISAIVDDAVSKIPGCKCEPVKPIPPVPPATNPKGDPNNPLILYFTVKDGRFARTDKEVERRIEDGYNIRVITVIPQEITSLGVLPRAEKFPSKDSYRGETEVLRFLAGLVK